MLGRRVRADPESRAPGVDDVRRASVPGAEEGGGGEGGVGRRPEPGLGAKRQETLDERRIGHEGEERREIGERVEAIHAGAGMRARGPGLRERARRGEKQVRKADARRQKQENAAGRVTRVARLPARTGKDRRSPGEEKRQERGERKEQERAVQDAGGARGGSPGGRERARRGIPPAARAGRRRDRWTRPRAPRRTRAG